MSAGNTEAICRVRLKLDVAVVAGADALNTPALRTLLLAVPVTLRASPVSAFARHICSRLFLAVTKLSLVVDGFVLHPSQRLCDVLADEDVVEVHVEGGAAVARTVAEVAVLSSSASATSTNRRHLTASAADKRGSSRSGPLALIDASPGTRRELSRDEDKMDTIEAETQRPATLAASNADAQQRHSHKRSLARDGVDTSTAKKAHMQLNGAVTTIPAATHTEMVTPVSAAHRTKSKLNNLPSEAPKSHTRTSAPGQVALQRKKADCSASVPQGKGPASITHPLLGQIEVLEGEDIEKVVQRKTKTLSKAVRRQVEYYFGEKNWRTDDHMREHADFAGFVRLDNIVKFDRLRSLTEDLSFIGESIKCSDVVELSSCGLLARPRWLQVG